MAVTIKDVAKLANVAPSTVSRVIANSPRISQKTKEKVNEAMRKLGYHPNLHARSLANKSSQALGIVMPASAAVTFQNPFFPEVIRGISMKADQMDYALYLSTGQTDEKLYEEVIRMVQGRRVDGIILLFSCVGDRLIPYLQQQDFPVTLIGKPFSYPETVSHVDTDNVLAARDATDCLLALGHQRIAFIGEQLNLVVTIDRLNGYKQALMQVGIDLRSEYILHRNIFDSQSEQEVMRMMALEEPPTAFIVTDDIMALSVIRTLDGLGIEIPGEVSIISFNNLMLAEQSNPPLTSVDVNIFSLGYQAAECLISRIENPEMPPKRHIIPHEIMYRQSCAPLKRLKPEKN